MSTWILGKVDAFVFPPEAIDDVRTFLSRASRLDPDALIRVRPGDHQHVQLWTVLPFRVLAQLAVPGTATEDMTVRVGDIDAALPNLGQLPRHDRQWRGSLPTSAGDVVEELTVAECRQLGDSAATTLESARGRGVGDRRLRDALLDHVAVEVTANEVKHEVRMRLILGLLRMGFATTDGPVRVRVANGRLGLETGAGAVWEPTAGLSLI